MPVSVARIASTVVLLACFGAATSASKPAGPVSDTASKVPAFDLPVSEFASDAAKRAWYDERARLQGPPAGLDLSTVQGILAIRAWADPLRKTMAEEMRTRHEVVIESASLSGISVDIVTPKSGISPENMDRVLVNLHGGGFIFGARWEGLVASIPIAARGRIKVITVDYRMGPEHRFPAASEDVGRVYAELLKTYRPENIGLYGCSAGAILTAQSVAWFQSHRLPSPGAIAWTVAAR